MLRPEVCPEFFQPTCGCDNLVHSNECDTYGAGVDVNHLGTCKLASPGVFACGAGFCETKSQYCVNTASDVAGVDDSFGCNPLPPSCGPEPSCGCIKNACAGTCKGVAATGLTVACPGG